MTKYPGDKSQRLVFPGGREAQRVFIDRQSLVGDDGVITIGICKGLAEGVAYSVTMELWPEYHDGHRLGGAASVMHKPEAIQDWLDAIDKEGGEKVIEERGAYDAEVWRDMLTWGDDETFTVSMGTPSKTHSVTLSGLGRENLYEILERARSYLEKN